MFDLPHWTRQQTLCQPQPRKSPRKTAGFSATRNVGALQKRAERRGFDAGANKLMVDAGLPTQQLVDGLKRHSADEMRRFKKAFLEVAT